MGNMDHKVITNGCKHIMSVTMLNISILGGRCLTGVCKHQVVDGPFPVPSWCASQSKLFEMLDTNSQLAEVV